jgi:SAM-dependent methyltransferase
VRGGKDNESGIACLGMVPEMSNVMVEYDVVHKCWARAHAAGSPVRFVRQRIVLKELEGLDVGNTLDAGCGTGEYALFLAKRGHKVTAFDPSPFAVESLRMKSELCSGMCSQVSTIEKFASAEPFDNIVCIEVIEHLRHDKDALHKLYSLLNRGGRMVVSAPASPFLYSEGDRVSGHYRRYSYRAFEQLLVGAGLKVIRLRRYGFPLLFGYFLGRKMFLDRILIRHFSGSEDRPGKYVPILNHLYPVLLFFDTLNIPIGSVGYVATCRK